MVPDGDRMISAGTSIQRSTIIAKTATVHANAISATIESMRLDNTPTPTTGSALPMKQQMTRRPPACPPARSDHHLQSGARGRRGVSLINALERGASEFHKRGNQGRPS